MRKVLSRPEYLVWQEWKYGSGTKHLVFIVGHPSKYWPCSLGLNQPTVPVLQPPLHLSSLYLNQCKLIVNWTLRNKFQWHFIQNLNSFIHENAFQNVLKMVVILSRSQCINILLASGPPDVPDIEKNTTGVFVPQHMYKNILKRYESIFDC